MSKRNVAILFVWCLVAIVSVVLYEYPAILGPLNPSSEEQNISAKSADVDSADYIMDAAVKYLDSESEYLSYAIDLLKQDADWALLQTRPLDAEGNIVEDGGVYVLLKKVKGDWAGMAYGEDLSAKWAKKAPGMFENL